jgi:hypothetical protein
MLLIGEANGTFKNAQKVEGKVGFRGNLGLALGFCWERVRSGSDTTRRRIGFLLSVRMAVAVLQKCQVTPIFCCLKDS